MKNTKDILRYAGGKRVLQRLLLVVTVCLLWSTMAGCHSNDNVETDNSALTERVQTGDKEQPVDPPVSEDKEQPADPPVSEDKEQPADPPVSGDKEQPADPPVSEDKEQPADLPVSEDKEQPVDLPVSEDKEQPADPPVSEDKEQPVDSPVSEDKEQPADPPVSEDKEQPVDPPVSEDKEQPADTVSSGTSSDTGAEQAFRDKLMQYKYVGSAESDKYHIPTCRWTKKILDENLVHFDTKEEAEAAGYSPCGTCHP